MKRILIRSTALFTFLWLVTACLPSGKNNTSLTANWIAEDESAAMQLSLLSDTLVTLLLYADSKRILLTNLDCRFLILVFSSFHAVCFHSCLVCAFFASSTLVCFADTSCWIMLSVSIPEISPDNLIVDDAILVSSYLFSSTRMPAISHTLAIMSKVFSGGSSLMTFLVSLSMILIVMRFVAS